MEREAKEESSVSSAENDTFNVFHGAITNLFIRLFFCNISQVLISVYTNDYQAQLQMLEKI
jgi:hypothetical protein